MSNGKTSHGVVEQNAERNLPEHGGKVLHDLPLKTEGDKGQKVDQGPFFPWGGGGADMKNCDGEPEPDNSGLNKT